MLLSVSPYLGLETQRAFKSPSCLLFAILLVSQLFSIDVIARPLRPLVPAPPPAPAPLVNGTGGPGVAGFRVGWPIRVGSGQNSKTRHPVGIPGSYN
ncbi:hypothetical protein F5878DRAFT_7359 [Lentinula raphanica]|uniref:Uncharacterized protein n=1 Tax=Lentinula raphanica TaxID=153919 RepID=A0AA38U6F4_9AGAR|nr:hypothetical protein F5878DRAFT_7359 [Lentinula raphanica]